MLLQSKLKKEIITIYHFYTNIHRDIKDHRHPDSTALLDPRSFIDKSLWYKNGPFSIRQSNQNDCWPAVSRGSENNIHEECHDCGTDESRNRNCNEPSDEDVPEQTPVNWLSGAQPSHGHHRSDLRSHSTEVVIKSSRTDGTEKPSPFTVAPFNPGFYYETYLP